MPAVRFQSLSLALHAIAVALALLLTARSLRVPPPIQLQPSQYVLLAPRPFVRMPAARGGGSNSSGAPARQGIAPPRSYRTFVPPHTHPDPKLPMTPTIAFDVPKILLATTQYGDPFGKLAAGGFGTRGGHGIGDAPGGDGIGDEPGAPGLSGRFGMPITPAALLYRVEPEFSEEARKARFQGMVVLMIDIGIDGRAHNLRVVESPGLGLDVKAVQAVEQWRFRPAQRGGRPLVSSARVEVHFHLM